MSICALNIFNYIELTAFWGNEFQRFQTSDRRIITLIYLKYVTSNAETEPSVLHTLSKGNILSPSSLMMSLRKVCFHNTHSSDIQCVNLSSSTSLQTLIPSSYKSIAAMILTKLYSSLNSVQNCILQCRCGLKSSL